MASPIELTRFRNSWPNGFATCAQGCLLSVFEDGWMTCVDFGDSQCLCRPIRVMAPDSDQVFSNCMNRDCEIAESEDYISKVTSYCSEADAERATRTAEPSTSSATVLSTSETTESESSTASTTDSPPTVAPPAPTETNVSGTQGSETQAPASQDSGTGGLSPGAKGGIAAGVILGVAALVLLAFFLFRRHRKSSLAAGEGVATGSEKGGIADSAELEGGAALPDIRTRTTDDPYISELDASPMQRYPARLSELDGMGTPGGLHAPGDTGRLGDTHGHSTDGLVRR